MIYSILLCDGRGLQSRTSISQRRRPHSRPWILNNPIAGHAGQFVFCGGISHCITDCQENVRCISPVRRVNRSRSIRWHRRCWDGELVSCRACVCCTRLRRIIHIALNSNLCPIIPCNNAIYRLTIICTYGNSRRRKCKHNNCSQKTRKNFFSFQQNPLQSDTLSLLL